MRISLISIFKPIALSIVAIAVMGLGQGAVRADEVYIAGSTAGCFGVACAPTPTATLLGLSYNGSTFSGTTANGFRALGGNPVPAPGANVNNLGSFSLSAMPAMYDGNSFTLRVTFTDPQGISGSNQATFTATVTGTVIGLEDGGVLIDFTSNGPILFTFNDTDCSGGPNRCGSGSFMFSVNDVAIEPGQIASVTGQITSAQQVIPEPTSMLLLGTGLAGVAAAVRRKLRARQQK